MRIYLRYMKNYWEKNQHTHTHSHTHVYKRNVFIKRWDSIDTTYEARERGVHCEKRGASNVRVRWGSSGLGRGCDGGSESKVNEFISPTAVNEGSKRLIAFQWQPLACNVASGVRAVGVVRVGSLLYGTVDSACASTRLSFPFPFRLFICHTAAGKGSCKNQSRPG